MTSEALDSVIARLERMRDETRRAVERCREESQTDPGRTCVRHQKTKPLAEDASAAETVRQLKTVLIYGPCPECFAESNLERDRMRIEAAGVPDVLNHASFDSFSSRDESESKALASAIEFAQKPSGFLFLLGRSFGCGKSHLAVSILRYAMFELKIRARFLSHRRLMSLKSAHYSEDRAPDPVDVFGAVPLLVLDELGVSRGGRDDVPTVQALMLERYERRCSTVITSNMSAEEVKAFLPPMLVDRLSESVARVITLEGSSHRRDKRTQYLS